MIQALVTPMVVIAYYSLITFGIGVILDSTSEIELVVVSDSDIVSESDCDIFSDVVSCEFVSCCDFVDVV